MASLETINSELNKAAIILDQLSYKIREAPELESKENILLIAKALTNIFLIQQKIHLIRPDLVNTNE